MSIEIIGRQIADMRMERGIRQEELAKYVGVSTQAVSKWENGGAPDIELLPKIADFFGVLTDFLFDRFITDYSDLQTVLTKKIMETSPEQQFKCVFEYCWDMERALCCGKIPTDGSVEEYENDLGEQEQIYSSVMSEYGFTRMGIANRLQYFLLVPEIRNTDTAFFDGIDYPSFFKDLSDKDFFDACVFLNRRESGKAFTPDFLVKNLKIDTDKAVQIIATLEKYGLLNHTEIEMDDDIQTVYKFNPTSSFVALLIFAREMIKAPGSFSYYCASRNKPYFN